MKDLKRYLNEKLIINNDIAKSLLDTKAINEIIYDLWNRDNDSGKYLTNRPILTCHGIMHDILYSTQDDYDVDMASIGVVITNELNKIRSTPIMKNIEYALSKNDTMNFCWFYALPIQQDIKFNYVKKLKNLIDELNIIDDKIESVHFSAMNELQIDMWDISHHIVITVTKINWNDLLALVILKK